MLCCVVPCSALLCYAVSCHAMRTPGTKQPTAGSAPQPMHFAPQGTAITGLPFPPSVPMLCAWFHGQLTLGVPGLGPQQRLGWGALPYPFPSPPIGAAAPNTIRRRRLGNRWQEEALGHHQLLLSLADDTECKFCWHCSLRLFCLCIPPVLITVIEL